MQSTTKAIVAFLVALLLINVLARTLLEPTGVAQPAGRGREDVLDRAGRAAGWAPRPSSLRPAGRAEPRGQWNKPLDDQQAGAPRQFTLHETLPGTALAPPPSAAGRPPRASRSTPSVMVANADKRLLLTGGPCTEGPVGSSLDDYFHLHLDDYFHLHDFCVGDTPPSAVAAVGVIIDPRTMAADCVNEGWPRPQCLSQAGEYMIAATALFEAPLSLPVPEVRPMDDMDLRRAVVPTRHKVQCWPSSEWVRNSHVDSIESIVSGGGRCALLLDALDVHAYVDHARGVLSWYLKAIDSAGRELKRSGEDSTLVKTGDEGQSVEGEPEPEHIVAEAREAEIGEAGEMVRAEGQLEIVQCSTMPLLDGKGKWGAFRDTLEPEEWGRLENYGPEWADQELFVGPEDVFYVGILYVQSDMHKWVSMIEAQLLSILNNGGDLMKARGALLVYTPPGGRTLDVSSIQDLIDRANFEVVHMELPWDGDEAKAWSLHFLKTDIVSFAPMWNRRVAIFLDLDMVILGDILPYVSPRHLRMTPATHLHPLSPGAYIRHGIRGNVPLTMHHIDEMAPAYYNSGVMMAPAYIFRPFLFQTLEEARIEVGHENNKQLSVDQVMFEMAHYRLDPPFLELPHDVNVDSALRKPDACKVLVDPIVFHYHRMPLKSGSPDPTPTGPCAAYKTLTKRLNSLRIQYAAYKKVHPSSNRLMCWMFVC